jgi:hypothetical protein
MRRPTGLPLTPKGTLHEPPASWRVLKRRRKGREPRHTMRRMASVRTIVLLFVYGLGLCFFGFLFGGAGHGIYGPLGLAGSPFSAIGVRSSWGYEPAFVAAALQWGLLGCAMRWMGLRRAWVVAFLAVHYTTAALLLSVPSSPYADWAYGTGVPEGWWLWVALGVAWYLAGQVLVWRVVVKDGRGAGG